MIGSQKSHNFTDTLSNLCIIEAENTEHFFADALFSLFHAITNLNMKDLVKIYLYGDPWPTINIRPHIMHFRRLAFSYTEVIY